MAPNHLISLNGSETVVVLGVTAKDGPAPVFEVCTTQDIANLGGGGGLSPANPTATAGPTAVNGSANTYMRSDAAPAIQKASASVFGIVEVDGTTITASGGRITAVVPTSGNPTATAGPTAVNGTSNQWMRADAAPAIQLATAAQKGLVQVDGTTITATAGVISATGSGGPTAANPTATAGPAVVNGIASTYMRSDAAPAVQLGTDTQKGIVQVDGTTITAASGVISVPTGGLDPQTLIVNNTYVVVGNGSGHGHAVPVTGDLTIANTGVTTLKTTLKTADIAFIISGGGSAITTGLKGYLYIDFPCTITQSTLLADQSGSIVVNIWECPYANFNPGTHPVAADKITASAPPTISSGVKAQDSTLTGWTTSVAADSVLAFNVDSVSTVTQVTLTLKVIKS